MRFERPARCVVKIGSSSLRGEDGRLDRAQVAALAEQVAQVHESGTQVVLVSSGAVASGMGMLGMPARPTDLPTLQAAAAVGQGELIHEYNRHFAGHGLAAGQVLLTQDDFVRRARYLNARQVLHALLDLGTIPVVNENDTVATEELAYGDNDHLAALVTSMLHADLLVLLSDVDGLYAEDPRNNTAARLIARVDDMTRLDARVGGSGTVVGRGGMRTKVEAARVAVASKAHAVVADARMPNVLESVLSGQEVGTWFVAGPKRLEARRLWIAWALTPHGRVVIDDGAVTALVNGGRSLLAVGVVSAAGDFAAGDAVEVVTREGRPVARGLVNYSVADVERLAGLSTSAASEQLGPAYAREIIHRDDLAVFSASAWPDGDPAAS